VKITHLIMAVLMTAGASIAHAAAAVAEDDTCIIDQVMKDNRVAMDKMAAGIYETNVNKPMKTAIESAPSVKDAACLPMLDTLDTLIRLRIPSIGGVMGGFMTKIRDMACSMANSYLENLANKAQFNYSDPLGVASVGIGGNTNGTGGTQVENYDLSKVVEDQATTIIKQKVQQGTSETNSAINQLPVGPTNRTPHIDNTIRNGMNDALNGL
jgi:hypothetical protein